MREVNIIILLRKYDLIGVVSYGFGCGSEYEGRIDYEIMGEHVQYCCDREDQEVQC